MPYAQWYKWLRFVLVSFGEVLHIEYWCSFGSDPAKLKTQNSKLKALFYLVPSIGTAYAALGAASASARQ